MIRPLLLSLALVLAGCATVPTVEAAPLDFVEGWEAARAEAARTHRPLFVDAWAPWCHTCIAMREEVLHDPRLGSFAERFVFAAVDTERPESAGFLSRHPIDVWPTLLVLDPTGERVLVKWAGSATLPQLQALLEDAERALAGGQQGALAALAEGDALLGEGKAAEAAERFGAALEAGGPSFPRRARAAESRVTALYLAGRHEPCAREALALLPTLGPGPWQVNVGALGLSCAGETKDGPLTAALEAMGRRAVDEPLHGALADDRSSLWGELQGARLAAGDAEGAKADAEAWWALLERASREAKDADGRAVYDGHRVAAAIALGDPARALPAIEASAVARPDDYNPPARLALLFSALGRLDEALAASDRALGLVYGPRRIRVLVDRATLLEKRGDAARAKATLQQAKEEGLALPASQRPLRSLRTIEERLAKLP